MLAREIRRDARFSDAILIMLTSARPARGAAARPPGGLCGLPEQAGQAVRPPRRHPHHARPARAGAAASPPAIPRVVPPGGRRPSTSSWPKTTRPTRSWWWRCSSSRATAWSSRPTEGRRWPVRRSRRFDLILMDVQMPEMSGLEASAAIREREQGTRTHVPIVALTAHAMTGDRERCLAAGMDGYVSKPLRPDELFAAIEAVLVPPAECEIGGRRRAGRRARGAAARRRHAPGGVRRQPQTARRSHRPVSSPIPRGSWTRRDGRSRVRDAAALAASAHALKGSIGLFAQTGAYDAARRLESAARAGELAGHRGDLRRADRRSEDPVGGFAGAEPVAGRTLTTPAYRLAQRSFAALARGFARHSSAVGRTTSSAIAAYSPSRSPA